MASSPPRARPGPWGPSDVGIGLLLALAAFAVTTVAYASLVSAFDRRYDITGDDADLVTVRLGLATTAVYQLCLLGIAMVATRQGPRALVRAVGLDRDPTPRLARPLLAVLVAYAGVVTYAALMHALDAGPLIPKSTVPDAVANDWITLAMSGVVAVLLAPLAEESFFRGFMFTGLLRWGFWAAAMLSGLVFTLGHLDPGSVIPFFGVGLLMAWLYWSRGSLWDSILFHFLFNFTSFLLLAAGT